MAKFQTVIRSAQFVYSPYTSQEMQGFGQLLADTIRKRIQAGRNIYDQPAAPLKPGLAGRRGYPDYKAARGLQPIRDWTWTGHTLRCMKVLRADENAAIIGFLPEVRSGQSATAARIAAYNNYKELQFGKSAADWVVVMAAVKNFHRPLVALKMAA